MQFGLHVKTKQTHYLANFIEIGAQEHSLHTTLVFGTRKRKNTKKIQRVSGTRISRSGAIPFRFGM